VTDAQDYAEIALKHIRHLAETIGPRGSTTPQERRAAEHARDVLQGLGIDTRLEPFQSGRSTYRPFVLAIGAALLGTLVYAFTRHPVAAAGAAVLNALGAWGMFAELDFADNWMRRLLPTGPSQNAIGVVPAREETRHRRQRGHHRRDGPACVRRRSAHVATAVALPATRLRADRVRRGARRRLVVPVPLRRIRATLGA
jgi:hypothetical protein